MIMSYFVTVPVSTDLAPCRQQLYVKMGLYPRVLAVVCVGLLSALGCRDSGRFRTAEVQGTVTLNGKPFTDGALITFAPETPAKMAMGLVKPDGTFVLKTYADGDGATLGKHRVSIIPVTKIVPDTAADSVPEPASTIPDNYRSAMTSGWVFEVGADSLNSFHLDMQSE